MLFEAVMSLDYKKLDIIFDKDKRHIERMPNINSAFVNGNTVLHIAVKLGFYQMSNMIIDIGANIEKENNDGRTPLHMAIFYNRPTLVDLLISAGANLNAQDKEKNTPLMLATKRGFTNLVEMLLLSNAELPYKNIYQETVIDLIGRIEVYNVYHKYLSDAEIKEIDSGYSRTIINGHIRNTNRKDLIDTILTKMNQYINMQRHQFNFQFESGIDSLPKRLQLNHFIIHELLGKGGFGEVYLVQQKKTENYFALKAIEKKIVLKETSKKYAINERTVYAQFNHPFIIRFYRAFQSKNYLYLLCEHAPNGDLKSYIKKYKSFSEEITKLVAAQIILAIEHLHRKAIVYRDLKPDNILIDKEGFVKLADFGLCKEDINGNADTNSFCGSIAYLAPEIILRKGHGRAVDWYLLGTVIYEMLVGVPPYYSRRGKEYLMEKIKFEELKFYNNSLSSTVISLIRGLLNRDPNKRLGGGIADSEEIKKHPFFCNVNFEEIYYQHFIPPDIFSKKIEKSPNSNELTESQWYCNKELKNDMKPNVKCENDNYIENWDFDGFRLFIDKS